MRMRCYFHLMNSHEEILDHTGIEVSDLEDAMKQALLAVEELREETNHMEGLWEGWHIDIVAQSGTILASFPLESKRH